MAEKAAQDPEQPARKQKARAPRPPQQRDEEAQDVTPSYATATAASTSKKVEIPRGKENEPRSAPRRPPSALPAAPGTAVPRLFSQRESSGQKLAAIMAQEKAKKARTSTSKPADEEPVEHSEADDKEKTPVPKTGKQAKPEEPKESKKPKKVAEDDDDPDDGGSDDDDDDEDSQGEDSDEEEDEDVYYTDEFDSDDEADIEEPSASPSSPESDAGIAPADQSARKNAIAALNPGRARAWKLTSALLAPHKRYTDRRLDVLDKIRALAEQAEVGNQNNAGRDTFNNTLAGLRKRLDDIPLNQRNWTIGRQKKAKTMGEHTYPVGHPSMKRRNRKFGQACEVLFKNRRRGVKDIGFTFRPDSELISNNLRDPQLQGPFVDCLLDLMNSWPYPGPKGKMLRRMFLRIAMKHGANVSTAYSSPFWKPNRGWAQRYWFINPEDGKTKFIQRRTLIGYQFYVRPTFDAATDFYLHTRSKVKTGPRVLYPLVTKSQQDGITVWVAPLPSPESLAEQYRDRLQSAERNPTVEELQDRYHLVLKQTILSDSLLTTKQELLQGLKMIEYVSGFAPDATDVRKDKAKRGVPRIRYFGRLHLNKNGGMSFQVTELMRELLSMKTAHVCSVETLDGRYLGPVFKETSDVLIGGGTPVQTLLCFGRGMQHVHASRRSGMIPPARKLVTGPAASSTLGACDRCLTVLSHADLQYGRLGKLVCQPCSAHDSDAAQMGQEEASISSHLRANLLRDLRGVGREGDQELLETLVQEGTAQLMAQQADSEIEIEFYDGWIRDNVSRVRGWSAFTASQDKPFPVYRHETSGLNIPHAAGNLLLTYFFINLGKRRMLPGEFILICQYARGDITADELLEALLPLHVVNLGIPNSRNACIEKFSPKGFALWLHVMTTGQFPDDKGLNEAQKNPRRIFAPYCTLKKTTRLTDADKELWNKVSLQIDSFHNPDKSMLDVGPDGSLWPLQLGPRPEPPDDPWWWPTMVQHFSDKLTMLEFFCNRFWSTTDNEMTLCWEFIWQLNDRSRSLLDLPMRLWYSSCVRPSNGHDEHGESMQSSFDGTTTDLNDRQPERNNLLIETVTENFLRHAFRDEEVSQMKEILQRVMPNDMLYDPGRPLPADLRGLPLARLARNPAYGYRAGSRVADDNEDEFDIVYSGAQAGDRSRSWTTTARSITHRPESPSSVAPMQKHVQRPLKEAVRALPSAKVTHIAPQAALPTSRPTGVEHAFNTEERILPSKKGTADDPMIAENLPQQEPRPRTIRKILAGRPIDQYDWPEALEVVQRNWDHHFANINPAWRTDNEEGYMREIRLMDGSVVLPSFKDILALQPGRNSWLSDRMVDLLMRLWLVTHTTPAGMHVVTAWSVVEWVMGDAAQSYDVEEIEVELQHLINHNTEQLQQNIQPLRTLLADMDPDVTSIIFPMMANRNHHFQVMINKQPDKPDTEVLIFDSLRYDPRPKVMRQLVELIAMTQYGHWRNASNVTVRLATTTQQGNQSDCGILTFDALRNRVLGRDAVVIHDEDQQLDHAEDQRYEGLQLIAGYLNITLPMPKRPRTAWARQFTPVFASRYLQPIAYEAEIAALALQRQGPDPVTPAILLKPPQDPPEGAKTMQTAKESPSSDYGPDLVADIAQAPDTPGTVIRRNLPLLSPAPKGSPTTKADARSSEYGSDLEMPDFSPSKPSGQRTPVSNKPLPALPVEGRPLAGRPPSLKGQISPTREQTLTPRALHKAPSMPAMDQPGARATPRTPTAMTRTPLAHKKSFESDRSPTRPRSPSKMSVESTRSRAKAYDASRFISPSKTSLDLQRTESFSKESRTQAGQKTPTSPFKAMRGLLKSPSKSSLRQPSPERAKVTSETFVPPGSPRKQVAFAGQTEDHRQHFKQRIHRYIRALSRFHEQANEVGADQALTMIAELSALLKEPRGAVEYDGQYTYTFTKSVDMRRIEAAVGQITGGMVIDES